MSKPLNELTITEASDLLESGDVSSLDLTTACLDCIKEMDGAIHAFLDVFEQDAIDAANRSDGRRAKGAAEGPLDGIPLAIKDNMLVQGKRCTAGSQILSTHVAASDATVVRKLRDAGAVFLGKTNMDEFAMGSSTEQSAYGPTKNPHDMERVPGGSSGGSAAAVASHMCLGAFGSDTGGSIRQPAALCGIVGFKPTYGRVSRSGLVAMASSLDQIGPMTTSVEDAALLFEAIHGVDPQDQTTSTDAPAFVPAWRDDLTDVRVGLPRQAWGEGMTDEVRDSVMAGVEALKELGATVVDVDLPYADEALAVYYLLMPCEVSANLARFDGMRFGLRNEGVPLFETYAATRAAHLGPEARRRVLLGTYALSRGYYDAYYLKAKKVQTRIRAAYEQAFRDVDVLVTPTTPTTAFRLGEKLSDPLAMYLEDIFTVGVNVAGLPALSLPCGKSAGLPIGMHLVGSWFREADLLAVGRAFESSRT